MGGQPPMWESTQTPPPAAKMIRLGFCSCRSITQRFRASFRGAEGLRGQKGRCRMSIRPGNPLQLHLGLELKRLVLYSSAGTCRPGVGGGWGTTRGLLPGGGVRPSAACRCRLLSSSVRSFSSFGSTIRHALASAGTCKPPPPSRSRNHSASSDPYESARPIRPVRSGYVRSPSPVLVRAKLT